MNRSARVLLHLLPPSPHGEAGALFPIRPAGEAFLHLCTVEQAKGVLDRFFAGGPARALILDESELDGEVRWEDSYGHGAFPHLYGELGAGAVKATVLLPSSAGAAAALVEALTALDDTG